MNESIYLIDLDENVCIVNIRTLQHKVVSKNRLNKQYIDNLLMSNFAEDSPYTENLTPFLTAGSLELVMVTSFECNYSCQYCYQKKRKKHCGYEHLEPDDIGLIKDFFAQYCKVTLKKPIVDHISIIGGEPLLPKNRKTIEEITNSWENMHFSIVTNGSYLTDYLDLLVSNHFTVQVSLDGPKDMHYSRRKPGNSDDYDKAIEGIKQLLHHHLSVDISTVFNAKNYTSYSDFFDLLENLGWLTNPQLTVSFNPEIGCGTDDITLMDVMRNLDAFHDLLSIDSRANQVYAQRLIPGQVRFFRALKHADLKEYFPYRCAALSGDSLAFLPDGTVQVCLAVPNNLGCIGKYKPSIEIYEEKIAQLRKRRIDQNSKCKECDMKAFCGGGCLATVAHKTESISQIICDLWENPLFLKYL